MCRSPDKILLGGSPIYFKQRFSSETRGKDLNWTSNSFSARGAHAYNRIPAYIRNSTLFPIFKSKLKKAYKSKFLVMMMI